MSNERLRIPSDETYFIAVGLATIAFARAEWATVYCCKALKPDYIELMRSKKKTAGDIANDLVTLANAIEDQSLKKPVRKAAVAFKNVISDRNALLHGNPITSQNGEQRLFAARVGKEWTLDAVNDAADRFARVGSDLNTIYHDRLKP